MKRGLLSLAILSFAAQAVGAWARPPVVVELYTAQGCASCDKANTYIAGLADQKGVLPLTFSVDYWDYLGWKDTFARPEFADRQRAYAKRFGVAEVFTPQVVVDGRAQTAAVKPDAVEALVRDARDAGLDPPQMSWRGKEFVAVGGGRRPHGGAGVWLIRYDPRESAIEVKDGDNRGHKVAERNVVAQLVRLGAWRGRPVLLKLPAGARGRAEDPGSRPGRQRRQDPGRAGAAVVARCENKAPDNRLPPRSEGNDRGGDLEGKCRPTGPHDPGGLGGLFRIRDQQGFPISRRPQHRGPSRRVLGRNKVFSGRSVNAESCFEPVLRANPSHGIDMSPRFASACRWIHSRSSPTGA